MTHAERLYLYRVAAIEDALTACVRDGFRGWLEVVDAEPLSDGDRLHVAFAVMRHSELPRHLHARSTFFDLASMLPTGRV